MAKYDEVETLLQVGEYAKGNDAVGDEAIAKNSAIRDFLNQRTDTLSPFAATVESLAAIVGA
jgi:ATP synthase in type III secretion protein N